ncbi:DUF3426 domain-containing protein [Ferrovibrio sp.]|uniref:DUF3426 domain-containing protein n=1 Tax=Ferrovibrio sp. TaxID=1917215 RepID=UPI003D0EEDCF
MFPSDTFALPETEADPEPPPIRSPFEDAEAEPDAAEAAIERRRARLAEQGLSRGGAGARKQRRPMLWLGWLLLLVLLGAVLGGGYAARTELVGMYPPLAKVYEKVGIHVEPAKWLGVELHSLKSAVVLDGGESKIEVSGEVVNVSDRTRPVPPIRVTMRGAAGKELNAYTLTLEDDKVAAGARLTFSVKLPGQKEEVLDLEVAFAPLPSH